MPSMPSFSLNSPNKGLTPSPEAQEARADPPRLTSTSPACRRVPTKSTPSPPIERPMPTSGSIDRLLASPQLRRTLGRHWLDVVRFAQTNGLERDDEKPHGLALSRLRHPCPQSRQALRPVPQRATRRRRDRAADRRCDHRHRLTIASASGTTSRTTANRRRRTSSTTSSRRPARRMLGLTHRLCPLPRPQVRSDRPGRLLQLHRVLPEHPPLRQSRPTSSAAASRSIRKASSATCHRAGETLCVREQTDRRRSPQHPRSAAMPTRRARKSSRGLSRCSAPRRTSTDPELPRISAGDLQRLRRISSQAGG